MRKIWPALFALAIASCGTDATVVEVTFEPGAQTPTGIVSIDLSLGLAGKTATTTFTKAGGGTITLPTTAALQIGSGLTGMLTIDAIARDGNGKQLDHGTGTANVVSGSTAMCVVTFGGAITGQDLGPGDDGPPPQDMAMSPAMLAIDKMVNDFGSVITGMSAVATFTITNNGDLDSGTITTGLSGTNANQFSITSDTCNGMTLGGGAMCTVQVTFSPTSAVSNLQATLTASATPGGSVTSMLSGTGLAPGNLMVSPMSNAYTSILTGTSSAPVPFMISNSGGVATGVPSVNLTGTDAGDFTISTNNCTAALGPGANCTVSVAFTPMSAGAKSAALTVTASPGGAVSPPLTGTALSPAALGFSPTSKADGTVNVGSSSASTTFTLSNGGTQTSTAVTTSTSGNTADFTVTDNCNGKTLGAACTYDVVFSPKTYGNKSLTVTATAATGGAPSFTVTGTGQDSVALSVTVAGPGTVTGGGINCTSAGGSGCSVSVTRNSSTPTVTLTETPNAGQTFSGWGGACSGTNTTCTVSMAAAESVTATFSSSVVTPNIYYTFDGNSNNTGSTAGMNLTTVGVTYVTGKFGQAAQISATGYQYVPSGVRAVLDTYTSATIALWIHDWTANGIVIDTGDNRSTAPYGGLQLFPSAATSWSMILSNPTNSYCPSGNPDTISPVPATGAWHHYMMVFNRSGSNAVEIWNDGVQTQTISGCASIFGAGEGDSMTVGQTSMLIDDVKIYNQVFTQAQQCTTVIGGTWNGTSCALP